MPETSDWKQKYRDSLLEMEGEEKRWRRTEQALRRLVGRLCAAGMGVHPQLDDELKALAAANRRNADAMELENLAASLTTAVVAVDAVAPVPTIITKAPVMARWDSTCAAVGKVLQCPRSLSKTKLPGARSRREIAAGQFRRRACRHLGEDRRADP